MRLLIFKQMLGGKSVNFDSSIWEKDDSRHGGEQFKCWENKRSWEHGEKPNSLWPDGRIRK